MLSVLQEEHNWRHEVDKDQIAAVGIFLQTVFTQIKSEVGQPNNLSSSIIQGEPNLYHSIDKPLNCLLKLFFERRTRPLAEQVLLCSSETTVKLYFFILL